MMRTYLFLIFAFANIATWASSGSESGMHASINLSDKQSLQRGARTFVNYCLSCHSAAYMRFNRLGSDLGIDEGTLKANLMFVTDKVGNTMTIAMNKTDAERYFGVAPPDLSVIARVRGADWLYTYFMTFYRDPIRPTGVNNLAFKDVGMPHVLWELQGWQRLVQEGIPGHDNQNKAQHLELETRGTQSPEEYQRTVNDLVNFLVYLGEPIQLKRYTIGYWVIVYLLILLVIVYMLKKEYWKDVH